MTTLELLQHRINFAANCAAHAYKRASSGSTHSERIAWQHVAARWSLRARTLRGLPY